jgi:hypothetical protein
MLENSLLNFSGAINPVTVQTMQLLVGDESLQFEFVSNQNSTAPIPHNETFNPATKQFTSSAGIIQHKTLGITDVSSSRTASDYKWWSLPEYISAVLDQQEKSYYLYAKVSKTNNTGTFLLSETAIAIEQVSGFYHLLVGILNSENDGDRSYSPMYGYSELTPGRLMIKKLISPSGNVYFDLDKGNGDGEIAGNIKFRASDNSLKTVEQAIDEVEVGGRNLILNTKSSNTQVTFPNGVNYRFFFGLTPISNFGLKAGDSVVLAFNLDGVPAGYYCGASFAVEVNGSVIYAQGAVTYQSGQRAFLSYKLPAGTTRIAPYISMSSAAVGSISFDYNSLKLEKGNKMTGWSPAPEDVTNAINAAQTQPIQQISLYLL